jgi:nucleoside phosphorylase
MSDKQKKFVPSAGYIVSVHQNALGIRAVAKELDVFPEALAEAMERAGFQMAADPFDLSADAGKLIKLQARQEAQGLHVVKESDGSDSNSATD